MLTGLEIRGLWVRRSLWVGVALTLLAAMFGAGAGLAADADKTSQVVNGWRALANGMAPGAVFAALAALLLGSQMVAAEADDGSLRTLLTRPVSRSAIVCSKALALLVAAVLLTVAAYVGGVVVGGDGALRQPYEVAALAAP